MKKRILISYYAEINDGINNAWGNFIVAARRFPPTADDIVILEEMIVKANAENGVERATIMNIIQLADEEDTE